MYQSFTKTVCRPPGYIPKCLLFIHAAWSNMNEKDKRKWIMRINLTTILFIFTLMQVSAASFGQRVTFKKQNATLENVIREIRKQTSYDVLIPTARISTSVKIDANFSNATLDEVMTKVLEGRNLSYTMEANMIIVKPKDKSVVEKVMDYFVALEIKGKVTDEDGNPIPGASVRIKENANRAAVTNSNGEFKITVNDYQDIILVSYVGYNTREVKLKEGQTSVNVRLDMTENKMKDVVITGISERKKEIYTGSSTTFTGKDLMKLSSSNILQGLGLLDPSFRIIDNNLAGSDPNAMPNIEIRGSNTLSENYPQGDLRAAFYGNPNLPLFILDGFETSLERIIDLDMNRIESLTLLKDGSAAAIYGTRSANGVVVIVTKAPAAGKLRASYAVSSNLVIPDLRDYRMLDAPRLLELEQKAGVYSGAFMSDQVRMQDLYNERLANVKSGVDTYWLSQPLKTAMEQRHSLTLDGGDQALKYSIGFGAAANPGIMKGSSRNTYQGNMLFHYNTGKFLFRNDLQIANTKGTNSPYGSFQSYVNAKPYFSIPEVNGVASPFLYETFTNGERSGYIINPLYDATLNTQSINQYTEIVNNFSAEWNVTAALRFRATAGLSKRFSDGKEFYPADHSRYLSVTPDMAAYPLRGDLNVSNTKTTGYEGTFYGIFSKLIKKHSIFFQSGFNIKESISSVSLTEAQGFPNPKMNDLAFAKQYRQGGRPQGLDNTSRLAGFLAAFNYAYDSRYFMDLSFKLDGSSQFGANEKFAPVWSAGIGWNLHREDFVKNLNVFSLLRVTGSIAETASQNFAPYQAMTKYRYETDKIYGLDFGTVIQGMGNPDLKWQTTRQQKIALDAGLFNSRVTVNAEYYLKNTSNLLQSITLAPSTGFSGFTDNIGELRNNGYEIRLNVVLMPGHSDQPRVAVWGNIGANENRISKISDAMKQRNKTILDAMQSAYDNEKLTTLPPNIFTEGSSRSAIYALPSLGIDPATGNEIFLYRDGTIGNEWRAAEQIAIADERPVVAGGFGATFNYKGWDAVIAGSYSRGGYLYNSTLVSKVEDIDLRNNNVDERAYHWKWAVPGDEAKYSANSFVIGSNRVGATSRFVQKNDYLTISAITLGYSLNQTALVKRLKIQNLRFSVSMNDLARFSTIEIERGTQYPFAQRISFGANVTF
ncbi:SusC/RagA family TonB-linked outer membrane protein [Pedobacter nyackensis]|uniref:SusC/RagA family TonB-linked outer membrane protein n=1 Tax=Pedobacter nyackensis TaxID=475255 RepID=UPI00292F0C59|nr:SusC/RagA family TonB-linked outer membrane protein [Pedobacter nyackensis]